VRALNEIRVGTNWRFSTLCSGIYRRQPRHCQSTHLIRLSPQCRQCHQCVGNLLTNINKTVRAKTIMTSHDAKVTTRGSNCACVTVVRTTNTS